jgi:hypothetical protein
MNVEKQLIKQVSQIKFSSGSDFVIPNHSGITGNQDAVNKLNDKYAHTPTNYRGTDFAGANPTKTLTHSRTLPDNVMLIIGGRVMHRTLEYTISGAVITMVDTIIDDTDYVMVCD